MPTENELEELTNDFLDDMMTMKEGDLNGGKAEQAQKLGTMAQCVSTDCLGGKNILED